MIFCRRNYCTLLFSIHLIHSIYPIHSRQYTTSISKASVSAMRWGMTSEARQGKPLQVAAPQRGGRYQTLPQLPLYAYSAAQPTARLIPLDLHSAGHSIAHIAPQARRSFLGTCQSPATPALSMPPPHLVAAATNLLQVLR